MDHLDLFFKQNVQRPVKSSKAKRETDEVHTKFPSLLEPDRTEPRSLDPCTPKPLIPIVHSFCKTYPSTIPIIHPHHAKGSTYHLHHPLFILYPFSSISHVHGLTFISLAFISTIPISYSHAQESCVHGQCHTLENHLKIFTWCGVLRTLPQLTFLPSLLKMHTNNGKPKETGTQRGYKKSFPTCINLNYKIQNCFPELESNAYIPSIQRHFLSSLPSLSQGCRSPFKRLTLQFFPWWLCNRP